MFNRKELSRAKRQPKKREINFDHEGHEEHEVYSKKIQPFVAFVIFVVR